MADISYGSHPELLSDLQRKALTEAGGVEILNSDESRALESRSLNLLPQSNWSSIEWEKTTFKRQFYADDDVEAAAQISELVSQVAEEHSKVIVFWGNLVIPSVRLSVGLFRACAETIIGTCMDLWVYLDTERVLIEYTHDGRITVADLP